MGTPVATADRRAPTLQSLTPESPMAAFRAYRDASPIDAVKNVGMRTGGSDRRSRADILRELTVAAGPPTWDGHPHTLHQYREQLRVFQAAIEPPASTPRPAAAEQAPSPAAPVTEDTLSEAQLAFQQASLLMSSLPVPPPVVIDCTWSTRMELRSSLTRLYQLSTLEGGFSEPPNMASAKGGKRNAFVHRHFDSLEFGRGTTGKVAIYLRTYLVGTGGFADLRAERPPQGSPALKAALHAVQQSSLHSRRYARVLCPFMPLFLEHPNVKKSYYCCC